MGGMSQVVDDGGRVADLDAAQAAGELVEEKMPVPLALDGLDLAENAAGGDPGERADEAGGDVGVKEESVEQMGRLGAEELVEPPEGAGVSGGPCSAGADRDSSAAEHDADGAFVREGDDADAEAVRGEGCCQSIEVKRDAADLEVGDEEGYSDGF
jgi:hypothetical protein